MFIYLLRIVHYFRLKTFSNIYTFYTKTRILEVQERFSTLLKSEWPAVRVFTIGYTDMNNHW